MVDELADAKLADGESDIIASLAPGAPTEPVTEPVTPAPGPNPTLPAGPSAGGPGTNGGGIYRDTVTYTPQEVYMNNILGASESFRNNLVLAAQNYRNNLVLGAGASRVMTGDTMNLGLYIFLLFTSGLAAAGALILGKRKKKMRTELQV